MLALIDYRYVRFYPFCRTPKARVETIFGMEVIRLTAVIGRRSGRCGKSARALSAVGADMACFSEGFPAREKFNVREPSFSIAHEHLLPEMIARCGFEGDVALLVAGADPRSGEMLKLLAQRYRYVLTCGVPRGELERLRRTVGASVISEPSEEKIAEAELAVCLRGIEKIKLSPECVAVAANERHLDNVEYSKYMSQPDFDAPGVSPAGFDRRVLLSEALRRGALSRCGLMLGNPQILTK
ncbi:MAG: hypothetical protein GX823_04325 [Clostridiales bacterium]|nr:hypothetical protein [Clostridiales bacterium]